jgi:hypothetical protein
MVFGGVSNIAVDGCTAKEKADEIALKWALNLNA